MFRLSVVNIIFLVILFVVLLVLFNMSDTNKTIINTTQPTLINKHTTPKRIAQNIDNTTLPSVKSSTNMFNLNWKIIPFNQQKYYVKKSKKMSSTDLRKEINDIYSYYGFPKDMGYYQFLKESHGYCSTTENYRGAMGCYQFLSATAKEFNLIHKGNDYRYIVLASADASARYLRWLLALMFPHQDDPRKWSQLRYALAAFNAGHRNVIKNKKLSLPSFYETIKYVHDIELLTKQKAYWVRKGDYLTLISKRTGCSVSDLLRGNINVTSSFDLKANSVLFLPNKKTSTTEIIIKRGMSLYGIYKKTGVSVGDLKQVNSLVGDVITVGNKLLIPVRQVG